MLPAIRMRVDPGLYRRQGGLLTGAAAIPGRHSESANELLVSRIPTALPGLLKGSTGFRSAPWLSPTTNMEAP